MCPIGFALWLTLNPTWWTADHLSALQQSAPPPTHRQAVLIPVAGPGRIYHKPAPLPASLQAALTAIPEVAPWEIPLISDNGSPDAGLHEQQQAWARQALNVWLEEEWNADRSPILDDAACTSVAWEKLYQGRYHVGLPLLSRSLSRPSGTSGVNRTNWLLVEIGRRPAWIPIENHGRLQVPDVLFTSDNEVIQPEIRCRRTMIQDTAGWIRRYVSVWVEAER